MSTSQWVSTSNAAKALGLNPVTLLRKIDLPGGYRSPDKEWPQIQEKMIIVMNELEEALKPALKALKENT